ncbi:leucine-rich repeat-containing protein 34 isoform X2 [Pseudoliparis swirei]|uniref:leucine-rich repeat-containing protein 34 isoform X2 n=1 Tax=Pseudoliparis swirei TaxID=2059687 RepID=UPI0024BE1E68|nr:leucine-rich repeat-containing protein 34 isoform X2 [Pseudoliparis swirei]
MSELYVAFCAEHVMDINPRVLQALEKTAATDSVTIKLPGSHNLRDAERLSDGDALALSKCLRGNKTVTALDVRYNNITDAGVAHLADLLQEDDSSLLSLDLMFNDIQSDGAELLAKGLKVLTHTHTHTHLCVCVYIYIHIASLSLSLQCNSTLLSLRLSNNKIESRGAMHLARMLQVNSTLRELELADCHLDTQSVIALAVVLRANQTLRSVDISRPLLFSLQEEWAVHVSEMLVVNVGLVELHLGKVGLSDAGVERLSGGLRLNGGLRYLDLRCNRVTRDGVRHLADLLQHHPSLEVVDLSSNRIEDEGAVFLSEAVAGRSSVLRELSVRSNTIRTEGLLSLARAMAASTTLDHLYIWGNHLEEPVCQVTCPTGPAPSPVRHVFNPPAPPPQAFGELMASGRLPAEQTDVSPYEVDGRALLAEASHSLRRHYASSTPPRLLLHATTPPPPTGSQTL